MHHKELVVSGRFCTRPACDLTELLARPRLPLPIGLRASPRLFFFPRHINNLPMWPCGVVGDALASSKRSGKSTGFLLSAYTAAEVLSAESKAQLAGERDVIGREAADVRVAIEASQNAIRRLTELYGDGVINSPVTGIVGSLHLSEGSVVREAEPLMEIFTGPPFVLAYVPEGALYNVQKG